MVGNGAFAEMWHRDRLLDGRVFCHVFGRDVVPHLPPKATGDFAHVGLPFQSHKVERPGTAPRFTWVRRDASVTQLESLAAVAEATLPLASEQLPAVARFLEALRHVPLLGREPYSFYDHAATYYVATTQPDGVLTEFGDDF